MTTEELARDYALARQKSLHLSWRDTNLIQLAYLHGLEAGKQKWHDLRKDPNDLPKERKEYLCKIRYYESENTFNGCLFFDMERKGFFLEEIEDEDYKGTPFDVAEWCEIPQYKE